MIDVGYLKTPLGVLKIRAEKARVVEISFTTQDKGLSMLPDTHEIARQYKAYFNGDLKKFTLPFVMIGTPFQKSVWLAIARIPYGKTATYTEISKRIGRPGAVRAVANAVGANKITIVVPCHRVIRSDGKIGGYAWGAAKKRKLLMLEKMAAHAEEA